MSQCAHSAPSTSSLLTQPLLLLLLATAIATGGGSKCSSRGPGAAGCCQRNIKQANKSCADTGGKAPCLMKKATTTTTAAAPAPAAPAPAVKVSTGSGCTVGSWQQCGGEGYSGCTQCGSGFYCMPLSWNWHQCINN
jgi:hypothetical protein